MSLDSVTEEEGEGGGGEKEGEEGGSVVSNFPSLAATDLRVSGSHVYSALVHEHVLNSRYHSMSVTLYSSSPSQTSPPNCHQGHTILPRCLRHLSLNVSKKIKPSPQTCSFIFCTSLYSYLGQNLGVILVSSLTFISLLPPVYVNHLDLSVLPPEYFSDSPLLPCLILKLSRALRGSWAQKPFCVPHFLFVGNKLHPASLTFPEFQISRFKQLLIREGRECRNKGGTVKKQ